MKLLIAYDASACSQQIPADLLRAGLPRDCEAVVLTAADTGIFRDGGSKNDRGKNLRSFDQALQVAYAGARRIEAAFPSWKVEAQACLDSPASGILKKASEASPDLIVVGSHGHGAFLPFGIGSTAQRTLCHAKGNVRIARGQDGRRKSQTPRIILGLDGSQSSGKALRHVLFRYRRHPEVEIRLIAVIERSSIERKEKSLAKRRLEEASRRLRRDGFHLSSAVRKGHASDVLIEEARKWKADCIFVGTRGLGAARRLFLGSVSAVTAACAPCSVEVVK